MSIRTIIEINHDYIDRLLNDGEIGLKLYRWIQDGYINSARSEQVPGIRILGSRHHSETLALKVD